MKNQALFSSKDKIKKLKCCLLQYLFGALRVNSGLSRALLVISHASYSSYQFPWSTTQQAHDVKRTLHWCWCDMMTSQQRWYSLLLASCANWAYCLFWLLMVLLEWNSLPCLRQTEGYGKCACVWQRKKDWVIRRLSGFFFRFFFFFRFYYFRFFF